jgi:hypothetical protein
MNRTAQLRLLALLAAAIGLVAGSVITQRADDGGIEIRGRLGPTAGPNSLGHVRSQRAYLERVAGTEPQRPAAGLVSTARFVNAGEATSLVDGMEATAVFVQFPDNAPEVFLLTKPISETIATRAKELADAVRAEIVSLEAQLRDTQGPQRELLEGSLAKRRVALESLGPDCACVYGIGVEGTTLGALARLQEHSDVLLVDVPQPVVPDLKGWELNPILPSRPS